MRVTTIHQTKTTITQIITTIDEMGHPECDIDEIEIDTLIPPLGYDRQPCPSLPDYRRLSWPSS